MSPPSTKPQVLAALPGTPTGIAKSTGLVESTVRRHLCTLRDEGKAHIQKRKRTSGQPSSVWVAGPGVDAAPLKQLPGAVSCRKHRARVRKAIAKAEAGAKDDGRYSRHIARHMVKQIAMATRAAPQHPFSALFQINQEGAAC
jgi:predicted ArsR family transcriptional regulator